ncbi:MAG TPA: hypothetical protein VE777_04535 [Gaiellales bacterium]|jgi:hypothetical protein|nr:hypothetical protein [Gaiellales bacterium]
MGVKLPPVRRLTTPERLWLRYLIADLEGDVPRMRRLARVLGPRDGR